MAARVDLQSGSGRCRQAGGQAARHDGSGHRESHKDSLIRPESFAEFAPAKVNLFLLVTGRRPDGYHLLDSLAVFVAVGDELRGNRAAEVSLELAGPFARDLPAGADNLAVRAIRSLVGSKEGSRGARLVLTKNLPVASGIGGGSADAAAALRLVSRLWGIDADLPGVAASLGADVPVCLRSRAVRMRGIGERLDPAPRLPGFGILLANPGVPVQTADVFRGRQGPFSAEAALPDGWANAAQMAAVLSQLRNDLEPAAVRLCPVIGSVLAAIAELPGCLLARMSGSGGTCFGLFDSGHDAAQAAGLLAGRGWWVWGGAQADGMECEGGMAGFEQEILRELRDRQEVAIRTPKHSATAVTIWIVVSGDEVFIRSVKGPKGRWFRDLSGGGPATLEFDGRTLAVTAIPATDATSVERASREYLSKYRQSPYAEPMVRPEVLETTMRLEPRGA